MMSPNVETEAADHARVPEAMGLSSTEAASRLREYGPNRVSETRRHPVAALLAKLNGPVPWMLEASLVLEAFLRKWIEAAIIAALLVSNAILAFTQEQRAHRALALLRERLPVLTRVRRDGQWAQVRGEEVVPGDIVHVRMGDLVPADMRLSDGSVLLDQSSLTGESAPVDARPGDIAYSGSVVRRGEASGSVTATGSKSYFGKTAELVQVAKSESHLEKLIVGIVKYLVVLDTALAGLVLTVALVRGMPVVDVVPFVLMLLVASVPVALPATFTLASALGAMDLARGGALVTRLSAIEEAAAMQVLCSDKTGTLTENRLTLAAVEPMPSIGRSELLQLAALACDEATQDPLDLAILRALDPSVASEPVERVEFVPFDPANKRAEALVRRRGALVRVVKGAPLAVAQLTRGASDLTGAAERLSASGHRVLAVAAGPHDGLRPVGLLGFLDPPMSDSKSLIESLRGLGVRVVMVTGDALGTARAVAKALGLGDRVCSRAAIGAAEDGDVFAGVLPEDKFHLVQALQRTEGVVGMTGDGVNDAPALKQAEVGIAVSSATDVAKAAASIVLTRPGLAGVVTAVKTGRRIYQRMLTYTLNKIVKTIEIALFLSIGFLATGQLVTTPRLVLLLLLTNDFVTMSIARDRVSFSPRPDRWNVRVLVTRAGALAVAWLTFSIAALAVAERVAQLSLPSAQTFAFLVLVFGGQANVYLVRERRHFWKSMPSRWMLFATAVDLLVVAGLAATGVLMAPVAARVVLALLGAVLAFMTLLDAVKVRLFHEPRSAPVGP